MNAKIHLLNHHCSLAKDLIAELIKNKKESEKGGVKPYVALIGTRICYQAIIKGGNRDTEACRWVAETCIWLCYMQPYKSKCYRMQET